MDLSTAFSLLNRYASDLFSVHDEPGDYLFASDSAQRLFGWRPEQLVGTNAYSYFHPGDLTRIAENHNRALQKIPPAIRYRLRCADGSFSWVETRARNHPDPDTGEVFLVCVTSLISWGGQEGEAPPVTSVEGVGEGW